MSDTGPVNPYDNLKYRSTYRTRDGKKIQVWSDTSEPPLEMFDQAVHLSEDEFKVMVQYRKDLDARPMKTKKESYKKKPEDQGPWHLKGD